MIQPPKNLKKVLFILLIPGLQTLSAQKFAVSETEADNLALQLDTSMNHGNPEIFNGLVDYYAFTTRLQTKSDLIKNAEFLANLAKGLGLSKLGTNTLATIQNGNYKLLRTYSIDGQQHLLFRIFGDAGVNYQDLLLVKINDSIKVADVFNYLNGEKLSTMLSSSVDNIALMQSRGSLTPYSKSLSEFSAAVRKKSYGSAQSIFEKSDPEMQEDRHLMLSYISVCQKSDKKAYRAALERYSTLYPDAPYSFLKLIEFYSNNKQYDKALASLDRLDSLLKGDPFLNFLRGNISLKMGNSAMSKEYYLRAFEYDPGLWQNTKQLVDCQVMNNELVQANAVIDRYRQTPGFRQELVDELYADYPILK